MRASKVDVFFAGFAALLLSFFSFFSFFFPLLSFFCGVFFNSKHTQRHQENKMSVTVVGGPMKALSAQSRLLAAPNPRVRAARFLR